MRFELAVILATLSLGVAQASGPVGTYAIVERVTLEPNNERPERIRIEGVFTTPDWKTQNEYLPPQRGYLYFKLPDDPRMASTFNQILREWADLKARAGTGKVIGLGSRSSWAPRVRKLNEKPASPDIYGTGFGLVAIRSDTEYAPIRSLLEYR